MIELEDYQFSLIPDANQLDEIPFGLDLPIEVEEDGFDPGGPEWVTQDGTNPITGATRFGIDQVTGGAWTFDMFVNSQEDSDALESLSSLADAWIHSPAAKIPGRVAALRYQLAGRTRRVFGRPRRWSAPLNNSLINGMILVTAEFKLVDPLFYDDAESSVTIPFVEDSVGGLILPVMMPAVSAPPGLANGNIFVGGNHEAYPIIRFVGPIVNPSLAWGNRKLQLETTIDEGGWIEIDTQPWQLSIKRNDGASVPGVLARRQYLEDMTLPTGPQQLTFRGFSETGTAQCVVRWRGANSSL